MESKINLPFLPEYNTYLRKNQLQITWFNHKFSQSCYNYQNKFLYSNACTIIAVLMAANCHIDKIYIKELEKSLNEKLVYALARSILEGNRIYFELKNKRILNLTVPEAIAFAGNQAAGISEWKSAVYMENLSQTLYKNIEYNLFDWLQNCSEKENDEIYIILVAAGFSVLFIIQLETNTIILTDSHKHSDRHGALIVATRMDKMHLLCLWFCKTMKDCFNANPKLYELSLLYFKK